MAKREDGNGNSVWIRWIIGGFMTIFIALALTLTNRNSDAIGQCATKNELNMHIESAKQLREDTKDRFDAIDKDLDKIEFKIDKLIDNCLSKGE